VCCFIFAFAWRWDLARLMSFISSGTSGQGVKTACSRLPGSIKYFDYLLDSLSEETYLVKPTRALLQTPNYTTLMMPSKRGKRQTYGRIKPTDIIINEPQRYDCP